MKVNISSIREIRGGIVHFKGEQEAPDYNLELKFTDPIQVAGTVTNTGEGFLVQARLVFKYRVNCSRCLNEYTNLQEAEFVEEFVPFSGPNEDDSVYYFNGDYIDLRECISEHVLLALPMRYICHPICRGLCPNCGKNLNNETCQCIPLAINPQFEKLRNLLSTEGGGSNGKSKK